MGRRLWGRRGSAHRTPFHIRIRYRLTAASVQCWNWKINFDLFEWKFNLAISFVFDSQIIGAAMFIMTVWIRAEPGFEEWVDILNIHVYYIGIYILIVASFIVMVVSFLGCCSALMEHTNAIYLVSDSNDRRTRVVVRCALCIQQQPNCTTTRIESSSCS